MRFASLESDQFLTLLVPRVRRSRQTRSGGSYARMATTKTTSINGKRILKVIRKVSIKNIPALSASANRNRAALLRASPMNPARFRNIQPPPKESQGHHQDHHRGKFPALGDLALFARVLPPLGRCLLCFVLIGSVSHLDLCSGHVILAVSIRYVHKQKVIRSPTACA